MARPFGLVTAGGDDGFTLVETVMAGLVVVLLVAGFGLSMRTAFVGSHENHAAQEATALAQEQIEVARSLDWDELALSSVSDDAPLIDAATATLLATEAGLDADELLHVDPAGLLPPMSVEVVDHVSYIVWQYVSTTPDGLRRVIALVQWESEGAMADYRTSTLISEVSTR